MTANLSNIDIKIKQLREHANLTQSQVAEHLSVDQSLISKFEKGERSVNSDILNQLSILFCCPISAFMSDGQITPAYNITFRTDSLDNTGLNILSVIHKLALNQLKMEQLAGGITNGR